MKSLRKLLDKLLFILPYLIVFVYSFYQPSDPDLGWHLKYGEYFWQHGSVLRDNTFSTMMPNFHWANTSWLTDIISYSVFHIGGFFGLTILSAVAVTFTFLFFAKAFRLSLWEQTLVFPFVLYLESPVNSISFRGQQLAVLCIGVLFYVISLYKKNPKMLWFAVPLFLVWTDVDGEFLLGYVLFGLWVGLTIFTNLWQKTFLAEQKEKKTKGIDRKNIAKRIKQAFIEDRKVICNLFFILLCSLLVTFINPFGYGLYSDAFSHIGNPLLKDIGEYLPFQMYSQLWWNEVIVGTILVFGLFILGFRGKFFEMLPILGAGFLLFLLSLEDRRFAWPSYYLLFPILAMAATFVKPDKKKAAQIVTSVVLVLLFALIFWSRYQFIKYTNFTWDMYCELQSPPCSQASAAFLINRHLTHNLFSLYVWGGWLIWNYPQIKPTIDGRMHVWVQNGYSGFTDYYSVEQNLRDIDKTKYSVAYISPQKPVYNRLMQLTQQRKWREVYNDKIAAIFVRDK